ncbi:hypothetical protein UR09_02945 [Candidatus Nitromaritima sp. SCGC AAA799-A02]|nr:hypothetical protein UR09_02945 [Candidatus Nitromaritima sp. SCGC AAA799-A02]
MIQSLSTEVTISGSYETNTKSLFVAEGGLEKIKAEIKSSHASTFSYTGYSFGNTQEYIVNDATYPMTTITNPINYVGEGADWYITKNPTTLALTDELTVSNATWPIYKSVSVGTDFAIVSLERPRWFSSSPEEIQIPMVSEANNVANPGLLNKSVASNIELQYSNNLLTFQVFSDPADDSSFIDSEANDAVVIGSNAAEDHYGAGATGYDYGINSGATYISGIATFPKEQGRILVIYKCSAGDPGAFSGCDVEPYVIPDMNSNNKTFVVGNAGGTYYGDLHYEFPVGSGTYYCADINASNIASFSVTDGQRYKLEYVANNALPIGCEND